MASFTYSFTLHCKGKKAFINEFKELVDKNIKDEYVEDSEAKSPFAISFYGVNFGSSKFYTPFEPLMQEFTEEANKPLSFFYQLTREENSSDRSLRCGYAIFEGGVCKTDVNYDYGNGNKVKKKLAVWLGVENGNDEDAVDEDWRNEVSWQIERILDGETELKYLESNLITFETILAAASRTGDPMTLEELEEITIVPESLKVKVKTLLKKGYRLDVLEYISDDKVEKLINILTSGKGFSAKELFTKVDQYTAKDMPKGYSKHDDDDQEEEWEYDDNLKGETKMSSSASIKDCIYGTWLYSSGALEIISEDTYELNSPELVHYKATIVSWDIYDNEDDNNDEYPIKIEIQAEVFESFFGEYGEGEQVDVLLYFNADKNVVFDGFENPKKQEAKSPPTPKRQPAWMSVLETLDEGDKDEDETTPSGSSSIKECFYGTWLSPEGASETITEDTYELETSEMHYSATILSWDISENEDDNNDMYPIKVEIQAEVSESFTGYEYSEGDQVDLTYYFNKDTKVIFDCFNILKKTRGQTCAYGEKAHCAG